MGRYLGIDVGGTEIKYGIFDENGNEFIEESGSAKSVRDDLDKIIDILSRMIKSEIGRASCRERVCLYV